MARMGTAVHKVYIAVFGRTKSRTRKLNTPFACASGRALNNFAVTGTLLSPVHLLGYVYTALKKFVQRKRIVRSRVVSQKPRAGTLSL